jgi:hypothetical protein
MSSSLSHHPSGIRVVCGAPVNPGPAPAAALHEARHLHSLKVNLGVYAYQAAAVALEPASGHRQCCKSLLVVVDCRMICDVFGHRKLEMGGAAEPPGHGDATGRMDVFLASLPCTCNFVTKSSHFGQQPRWEWYLVGLIIDIRE